MFGRKKEPVDLVPQYWNWSPVSIFEDMERLFADIRSGMIIPAGVALPGERARIPMLDIREEKDLFLIQAELPGMNKEDVSIEMEGDMLRITAHREHELEQEEGGYLRKERGSVRFYRQIPLPDNVDQGGIKAKVENGVLDITLPKMPVIEEKKNKIEVE
jgi:HSP20 family protein